MTKQPHFGTFMRPAGIHTAWWRMPGAGPASRTSRKQSGAASCHLVLSTRPVLVQ